MQFNIIRTDGDDGLKNMGNYLMENYILAPKNLGKKAKKNKTAYEQYMAALKTLKELEFTEVIRVEASDPNEALEYHVIAIYFDPPGVSVSTREMIKVLEQFDELSVVGETTTDDEFGVLLLSKKIYTEN